MSCKSSNWNSPDNLEFDLLEDYVIGVLFIELLGVWDELKMSN